MRHKKLTIGLLAGGLISSVAIPMIMLSSCSANGYTTTKEFIINSSNQEKIYNQIDDALSALTNKSNISELEQNLLINLNKICDNNVNLVNIQYVGEQENYKTANVQISFSSPIQLAPSNQLFSVKNNYLLELKNSIKTNILTSFTISQEMNTQMFEKINNKLTSLNNSTNLDEMNQTLKEELNLLCENNIENVFIDLEHGLSNKLNANVLITFNSSINLGQENQNFIIKTGRNNVLELKNSIVTQISNYSYITKEDAKTIYDNICNNYINTNWTNQLSYSVDLKRNNIKNLLNSLECTKSNSVSSVSIGLNYEKNIQNNKLANILIYFRNNVIMEENEYFQKSTSYEYAIQTVNQIPTGLTVRPVVLDDGLVTQIRTIFQEVFLNLRDGTNSFFYAARKYENKINELFQKTYPNQSFDPNSNLKNGSQKKIAYLENIDSDMGWVLKTSSFRIDNAVPNNRQINPTTSIEAQTLMNNTK